MTDPNERQLSSADTAAQTFSREAVRELAELMAEVSGAEVRHGPKPRTLAQQRALLNAQLAALELEREEIAEALDALGEREESEEQEAPEAGARFMRSARKELALLIRE